MKNMLTDVTEDAMVKDVEESIAATMQIVMGISKGGPKSVSMDVNELYVRGMRILENAAKSIGVGLTNTKGMSPLNIERILSGMAYLASSTYVGNSIAKGGQPKLEDLLGIAEYFTGQLIGLSNLLLEAHENNDATVKLPH